MKVLYEDNHIIVVNKEPGEIVQGDKTGDKPLSEIVKEWIKERHNKPGNVFLGVTHRLDRPVGGVVLFAKTSKALSRLNEMFRNGKIHKTYWALTSATPDPEFGELINHLESVERNNKTYVVPQATRHSKEARLKYSVLAHGERYSLVEIELLTGRKHQIRAQLAAIGCPIKGDLKYGAKRSNPDGGISLLARRIEFEHPVSKEYIRVEAPVPEDVLWKALEAECGKKNKDGKDD